MKLIVLLVAAVLSLTGCASTFIPASGHHVTATRQAQDEEATQVSEADEEGFKDMVIYLSKTDIPDAAWPSLIDLGYSTCGVIDSGGSVEDMVQTMLSKGIRPGTRTGRITQAAMVAATGFLCPEHEGFFG